MRLNRVLLLAATINILIFALVFTISCADGADGKNGKDGKYCVVDQDFNIVCDDVLQGKLEGKPGADGRPGKNGKDGEGCWLGPKTAYGSYEIICGTSESDGQYKGTLDGCSSQSLSKYEIALTCGKTTVNICSGQVFDVEVQSCNSLTGAIEDEATSYTDWCGRSRTEFDKRTHYCGYAEADTTPVAAQGPPTTVYEICGGVDNEWAAALDIANGGHQPNSVQGNGYVKEYCRYYGPNKAKTAGYEEPKDFCETFPINKDSWKKQYCGYKSSTATKKTLIEGACDYSGRSRDTDYNEEYSGTSIYYPISDKYTGSDRVRGAFTVGTGTSAVTYTVDANGYSLDPQNNYIVNIGGWIGPNQKAFGQGYCEVTPTNKKTGKTTYSENLCGTGSANKINNGKWNNEYCGFKDQNSDVWDRIYKPLCDDDQGPNRIKLKKTNGQDSILRRDYCAYTPDGTTELRAYCGNSGTPNKSKWNRDYCGVDKTDPIHKPPMVHTNGLCDDGPYGSGGYDVEWRTIYIGKSGDFNYATFSQPEYANGPYSFKAFDEYLGAVATANGNVTFVPTPNYPEYTYPGSFSTTQPTLGDGTTPVDVDNQYYYRVEQGTPGSGVFLPSGTVTANKTNNFGYFKGYCKGLPNGKTILAHSLDTCFIASGNKRPNNGAWKKEYCGYKATGAATTPTKAGALQGIQANLIFDATQYLSGAYQERLGAQYILTKYELTTPSLLTGANIGNAAKLSTADKKNNPIVMKNDACEDGTGPNDGLSNLLDLDEGHANWATSALGIPEQLNIKEYLPAGTDTYYTVLKNGGRYNGNNYCAVVNVAMPGTQVRLSKKTTAVMPCGDNDKAEQPNKGKWSNEYCGYSNVGSSTPLTKQTGLCGDGYGPKIFRTTDRFDGFCQWPAQDWGGNIPVELGKFTIFMPKQPIGANVPNSTNTGMDSYNYAQYKWNISGYCVPNKTAASSNWAKMNEGMWRNQYCFTGSKCDKTAAEDKDNYLTCTSEYKGGSKVEACPGNRLARTEYKSTDPVYVRCRDYIDNTNICNENNPGLCNSSQCYHLTDYAGVCNYNILNVNTNGDNNSGINNGFCWHSTAGICKATAGWICADRGYTFTTGTLETPESAPGAGDAVVGIPGTCTYAIISTDPKQNCPAGGTLVVNAANKGTCKIVVSTANQASISAALGLDAADGTDAATCTNQAIDNVSANQTYGAGGTYNSSNLCLAVTGRTATFDDKTDAECQALDTGNAAAQAQAPWFGATCKLTITP